MIDPLDFLSSPDETGSRCGCRTRLAEDALVVVGEDCSGGAALADSARCRATVVESLQDQGAEVIRCQTAGWERTFGGPGPRLFCAGARFAVAVHDRDPRLARRARRDPLGAATEAAGRAGPIADVAVDAGLTQFGTVDGTYDAVLEPVVGPTIGGWRVDPEAPPGAILEDSRRLATGATVRIYARPERATRLYHVEPAEQGFEDAETQILADAHEYLAGVTLGGDRAPDRAVRAVAGSNESIAAITRVLRKHVYECGLLRDFFADPELSDVYVTAPASQNAVRVRVDGETLDTNAVLTTDGVAALASRFRRESGRGFSRAQPTLDAATTVGDRRVRVAGVTDPVSDGQGFAFRAHDRRAWTVPALVETGTMSAAAAGLLSVAVERGGAVLLAGPRGSGKTTTLGALLWEIPGGVRTVLIEDTPELPVETLQHADRDVQALQAEPGGPLAPVEALRSALRLGDGALVVGEVRGEEAGVLYEAMRVGANSEAVLGTIHGDGGEEVFERVVSDLGVPPTAFATTDLVVTMEIAGTGGERDRRVRSIEEVRGGEPVAFEPLFDRTGDGLAATGRIDRGNSRLVADLTRPGEEYSTTRATIVDRAEWLERLAETGRTDYRTVTAAHADRNE